MEQFWTYLFLKNNILNKIFNAACPSREAVTTVNSGTETCVTNPTSAGAVGRQCNWYLQVNFVYSH